MVAICSRSEATRPTLASQVNPKDPSTPRKDVARCETVPGLAPSVVFLKPVLDGKDGEFRCPIKSNMLLPLWTKYFSLFKSV
jgi:hypothetical protein